MNFSKISIVSAALFLIVLMTSTPFVASRRLSLEKARELSLKSHVEIMLANRYREQNGVYQLFCRTIHQRKGSTCKDLKYEISKLTLLINDIKNGKKVKF